MSDEIPKSNYDQILAAKIAYYGETKAAYEFAANSYAEISRLEGVLLGLKLCKEMHAQGTISHEEIYETEQYYKNELFEFKLKA